MKKNKVAEVIAKVAVKMAEKGCGAASMFGTHQTKESASVRKYFNK